MASRHTYTALALDGEGVLCAVEPPPAVTAPVTLLTHVRDCASRGDTHVVTDVEAFVAALPPDTMVTECASTTVPFNYFLDLDAPRALWTECRVPSLGELHALMAFLQAAIVSAVGYGMSPYSTPAEVATTVGAVVVASAVPLGDASHVYERLHAEDYTRAGAHAYWRLRVTRAASVAVTLYVRAVVEASLMSGDDIVLKGLGLDAGVLTRASPSQLASTIVDACLSHKARAQLRILGTPKVTGVKGTGIVGQPYRVVLVVNADGSRDTAREAALASGAESALQATLITPRLGGQGKGAAGPRLV